MNIKLDENLPTGLQPILARLGHQVHTPRDEGLSGKTDREIWEAAQRERLFLITQDLDFSDVRQYIPGTHGGILLVRLASPNRRILIERVESLFYQDDAEEWPGCFVVATEHKVRVRRPRS